MRKSNLNPRQVTQVNQAIEGAIKSLDRCIGECQRLGAPLRSLSMRLNPGGSPSRTVKVRYRHD